MKYVRIGLMVVAVGALLSIGGWYVAEWMIDRAFTSAAKEGDFKKLFDVTEATAGSILVGTVPMQRGGKATSEGAIGLYQNNPQVVQRDKKYFETWHSALTIVDAVRKSHRQLDWQSSVSAPWVPQSSRTDAWDHPFCVRADQLRTVVVSPGSQALSGLDCSTVRVSERELAEMAPIKLNLQPSGALIFFVKNDRN